MDAVQTWQVMGEPFELETGRFAVIDYLGSGAYGVVSAVEDRMQHCIVAIKKCKKIFTSRTLAKRTLREIRLLRHFNHENIIKLKTVLPPKDISLFSEMYLVFELMETDLAQIIRSPQKIQDQHVQFFTFQLLQAMQYLHASNVVHRDLKPRNLLINSNCCLKVADYGLSRVYTGSNNSKIASMTDYVTTRWYRAPEIIVGWPSYTAAVDMWAVGCIIAELIVRTPLFPGTDTMRQLETICGTLGKPDSKFIRKSRKQQFSEYLMSMPDDAIPTDSLAAKLSGGNPKAIHMCLHMLKYQPTHRLTAADALMHPYMASLVQTLPHYTEESPQQILGESDQQTTSLQQRYSADNIIGMRTVMTPETRAKNDVQHTIQLNRSSTSTLAEQGPAEQYENRENDRNWSCPQWSSSQQRCDQENMQSSDVSHLPPTGGDHSRVYLNSTTGKQPPTAGTTADPVKRKTTYYDFGCKLTISEKEFEFENRKLTYEDLREELLYEVYVHNNHQIITGNESSSTSMAVSLTDVAEQANSFTQLNVGDGVAESGAEKVQATHDGAHYDYDSNDTITIQSKSMQAEEVEQRLRKADAGDAKAAATSSRTGNEGRTSRDTQSRNSANPHLNQRKSSSAVYEINKESSNELLTDSIRREVRDNSKDVYSKCSASPSKAMNSMAQTKQEQQQSEQQQQLFNTEPCCSPFAPITIEKQGSLDNKIASIQPKTKMKTPTSTSTDPPIGAFANTSLQSANVNMLDFSNSKAVKEKSAFSVVAKTKLPQARLFDQKHDKNRVLVTVRPSEKHVHQPGYADHVKAINAYEPEQCSQSSISHSVSSGEKSQHTTSTMSTLGITNATQTTKLSNDSRRWGKSKQRAAAGLMERGTHMKGVFSCISGETEDVTGPMMYQQKHTIEDEDSGEVSEASGDYDNSENEKNNGHREVCGEIPANIKYARKVQQQDSRQACIVS